ncbi:DinB family protein [Gillisia sp. Q332]|uniref:DinB family protein n=1 Tax=Gillisia xinjiangensis TaxID=3384765 RepID=UPI00391C8421
MADFFEIRKQISKHLEGGAAFMPVEEMLKNIKFDKLGERPGKLPYSFYELFYHIKFAQKDILDYCTAEKYESHHWPDEYWPKEKAPASQVDWKQLKADYFAERHQLSDFLLNPENDLLTPVRKGTNHSLLREILLVIEHTAYHNGQLLILLRQLGLYSS